MEDLLGYGARGDESAGLDSPGLPAGAGGVDFSASTGPGIELPAAGSCGFSSAADVFRWGANVG